MENENPFICTELLPEYELVLKDGVLVNTTAESIFQLIRNIRDPEHPYSLEKLSIVSLEDINITHITSSEALCKSGMPIKTVQVVFTPTVPHCSMAGIIGLCIYYQISKYIKDSVISIQIKKETHSSYQMLNKQLSDKDRVMAAFENEGMLDVINSCIESDI